MIAAIIIIGIALIWLAYETKIFTIRLESTEYQKSIKTSIKDELQQINTIDTPYYWHSPDDKEQHVIICHNNWNCPYKKRCQKSDRWAGWKLPAITIKAWGHTLNLNEQCNIMRAIFLKSLLRELKRKPTVYQPPLLKHEYIYQERIGSHHEYVKWNHETNEYDYARKPKTGYIHRVVEDYNTNYRDCLPGRDWLKKHEHDVYPEPTIELSVGDKAISVNGDYRKGMIKEFIKTNKAE